MKKKVKSSTSVRKYGKKFTPEQKREWVEKKIAGARLQREFRAAGQRFRDLLADDDS